MATDFPAALDQLRSTYGSIRAVMNPEALAASVAELSEKASAPDLWDDPDAAQAVTSQLSHAQTDLEKLNRMGERIDDVETLVEMATEEDDADTLAEAERELVTLRRDLGELEVRTLLSGEYDERDAVVTIRSGAGGRPAAAEPPMPNRLGTFAVAPPQVGQAGSAAVNDWITSTTCPSAHLRS